MEEEESLIAAAHHISKLLETNKILTDETRKILANLGSNLSKITRDEHNNDEKCFRKIAQELENVQDRIMEWEKCHSMVWDYGPEEAYEYSKAVDETRRLIDILENKSFTNGSEWSALLRKAHDILQKAMSRLEEEFRHLLVQNKQAFETKRVSFRSSEDDIIDDRSINSSGDDSTEYARRESMGRYSDDHIIDLVSPCVIPDLKSIASLMFESSYGQECSQVFINVQKDYLDDCLFILEIDKLSIEDVLKMEWNALSSKIRRWIRAIKIFVRIYLASEKLLSNQIFGELDSVSNVCFAESSKNSLLQLLNFGEAIAIGPHQPEKLIRVLDMYEVLDDLIPNIVALFSVDEMGSSAIDECQQLLKRLGGCAKATFLEFENAVATNPSANAFPRGGVHPLTRYVMNYMKALMDYQKTLGDVLKDQDNEDYILISPNTSPVSEEEDDKPDLCTSAMALRFRSLISVTETNLKEKSSLYKDESLKHLFLMNNIQYMSEKVMGSELRTVLGDGWIRKRNWKFQQHAMNYERATWSSILGLLKDEGIQKSGSSSCSRTILKERLQSFYLAFEEVYKSQSGWIIHNTQLRDDLRISTSLKVIQAYRVFVGRHGNQVREKHIKYSADDLEGHLLNFFEGSQKSLHGGIGSDSVFRLACTNIIIVRFSISKM